MRLTRADVFPLASFGIGMLLLQFFDALFAPPGHRFLTDDALQRPRAPWALSYGAVVWLRVLLTVVPLALAAWLRRRAD